MWKPIYHPGPWHQYLNRKDNVGLPLMEVRRKYLTEQLQFDNFQSQQLAMLQGRAGGGHRYPAQLIWYGASEAFDPGDAINGVTFNKAYNYKGNPTYRGVYDNDGDTSYRVFYYLTERNEGDNIGPNQWAAAEAYDGDGETWDLLDTAGKLQDGIDNGANVYSGGPGQPVVSPTNVLNPIGLYSVTGETDGGTDALVSVGTSRAASGAT